MELEIAYFPIMDVQRLRVLRGEDGGKGVLKTEVGDIEFELSMVECRRCGVVISPFLNVIGE